MMSVSGPHATVSVGRGGSGAVIRNLEITGGTMHAVDFEAANCIIEDCVCHDTGADVIKCSPSSSKITIRRCEIYNSAGGAKYGWKSNAEGIDNVRSDDMLVQDCFIHDTATNGAYAKGGARRTIIERCLFMRIGLDKSVQGQGVILGEHAGGTKTYENFDSVVRNCIFIDISGAGVALWCADNPKVYNNTMINVAKTDRAGIIILQNHDLPTRNATIINNIVAVAPKSKKAWVWIYPKGHAGKLTMDSNVYFGGAGKFVDSRKGWKEYRTIAAWSQATGCDASSMIRDPGADLKSGHLKPGSPCIDKGKMLKEVADDYDGAKRKGKFDIGADEFKAGVSLPVPPAKGTVGTKPKKVEKQSK